MWRLMVVTFLFLALAFYQLSGGADFKPASASKQAQTKTPDAAMPAAPNVDAKTLLFTEAANSEAPTPLPADDGATRTVLTGEVARTTTLILTRAAARRLTPAPEAAVVPAVSTRGTAPDLRSVKGDRVNMRGGPGTQHQIVARLSKGDQVEVLESDGFGWLRLVDSAGNEGWIADFLITAPGT